MKPLIPLLCFSFLILFVSLGKCEEWPFSPVYTQDNFQDSPNPHSNFLHSIDYEAEISRMDSMAGENENYNSFTYTSDSEMGGNDEEEKEKGGGSKGEEEKENSEPAPFIWTDIEVPASFLRIEYMIGYSFMGLMYGLGFLVFFQSLVIPTAKFLTAFVYVVLVTQGLMEPITLEQALQQVPPN